MAEYAGRLPLFHLDLFRLADADAASEAGLLDDPRGAAAVIESWFRTRPVFVMPFNGF